MQSKEQGQGGSSEQKAEDLAEGACDQPSPLLGNNYH